VLPVPEHNHRRANESDTRRHRRAEDDTPVTPHATGIRFSERGISIPWAKAAAGIVVALNTVMAVAGGFLAKAHAELSGNVADGRSSADDKLNRILEASGRVERKVDQLDERQRATELDVAALKAREEKDRPR
jgi:hypothetical protein